MIDVCSSPDHICNQLQLKLHSTVQLNLEQERETYPEIIVLVYHPLYHYTIMTYFSF